MGPKKSVNATKSVSYASTVSTDNKKTRNQRAQLQAQASDISIVLSGLSNLNNQNREIENLRDRELLLSFRGNTATAINQSVIQYLKDESLCTDAVILTMYPGDEFRVFSQLTSLSKAKFPGVSQVLQQKIPALIDQNLDPWKPIFTFLPKFIALIPTALYLAKTKTVTVDAIVVLGFKDTLPLLLAEEASWSVLLQFCQLTVPLLINVKRYEEVYAKTKRTHDILQSISDVEKVIQDLSSCINSIGLELQTFFGVTHTGVFIVQDEFFEAKMLKYCCFGGSNINERCPDRELHGLEEVSQSPDTPIGWTAKNRKCFRANSPSDLEKYKLTKNPNVIHSVVGCIMKNIMCLSIEDAVDETPLVVEMSGKVGGFSLENEKEGILFGKGLTSVLSSAVLLDYRKKASRRTDITNEVLNNIKAVQFTKVKQLLDMKFRYSNSFQRKFTTFNYTLRHLAPGQIPGVVLYMFTELGFVSRWKIRRATLIRFILSIKQGYKDNPYHNWRHACTVTHFAYLILKKLELQHNGFLTDIEAFAFLVACLCHDVDHRGVNNHFSISADDDSYQLYRQEESAMERHHVAVTLQVLSTDDCNILESLSDEDYKQFVDLVQWNILATDLGKYLQHRNTLFTTLKTFKASDQESRRTLMAVLMIMCDLCESVKPWNDYILTVKSIFSEFFSQGDDEIKLGFNPTPIMDKKIAYIPYIEMKFINEIVRPAYRIIADVLPKTSECLHSIDYIKELWLVATKVFDDNTHIENPLQIIDLCTMKEENLRMLVNPELEKHVTRIRRSHASMVGVTPFLPPEKINSSDSKQVDASVLEMEKEILKVSCCSWFLKFLCCNKRKALSDAAFVRKFHQETEFMERRSEYYEKTRNSNNESAEDFKSIRFRINSLINPEPLTEDVKSQIQANAAKINAS